MRKLIYHVATSLDNFIAYPDGTTDAFLPAGSYIMDFLASIKTYGAVLMGRRTYEYGFQYGLQKGQPAYADINPELTNYVFSNTMTFEQTDRVQLVQGDGIDFVRQLKAEAGKPIWLCGGGELAGRLLDAQLIDQLIIKLNPVVLGEGIRLFEANKTKATLRLTDSKTYENGLIRLSYSVMAVSGQE